MELRSGRLVGQVLEISQALPCMLCLEDFLESPEIHHCSRCTGVICNGCMHKYASFRVGNALDKGTIPSVPCPGCRLPHWKPQQTFVAAQGTAFTEDLSFRVEIPRRERYYYVHGIHDGTTFVGFVVLHHWCDYYDSDHSFHINDAHLLKPFLVPIDALLTRFVCRVITEDDNIEHVAQVMKHAGAIVGQTQESSFWVANLHRLFLTNLNPF